MNIYKKIFSLLLTVVLLVVCILVFQKSKSIAIVRAFGPINVTFPSTPMFDEGNWMPGKSVTRSITIENTDVFSRRIGVKAYNFYDRGVPGLSQGLSIVISNDSSVIYGNGSSTGHKSLANFYSEPVIWLAFLPKERKANFTFTISMDFSKGNEYQGSSTTFDLLVGIESAESPFQILKPLPTLRPLQRLSPLSTLAPLKPISGNLPTVRPLRPF